MLPPTSHSTHLWDHLALTRADRTGSWGVYTYDWIGNLSGLNHDGCSPGYSLNDGPWRLPDRPASILASSWSDPMKGPWTLPASIGLLSS